ncbi:hypothetical protein Tco_1437696 [Tanacetum coccineum]
MRTRSSSNLIAESFTTPKRRNRRRSKQRVEPFSLEETYLVTMAGQRTMAELLQAPTEGYRDAIVTLAILAENFELKHGLLNLVTSKQFYGFEKEDPHAHILWKTRRGGTVFGFPPYPFNYPKRRLTIEEILAKFIDEVKGVTTRGGKMTSEVTRSKEINETGINKNEPPRFEQDVLEKPHDDGEENKSSSIPERTNQPLVKPQQSSIPFPNRVRKEKEEALQQKFLENLKQLDINIPFIEALVQIPKYVKYLKSLLTINSDLKKLVQRQ